MEEKKKEVNLAPTVLKINREMYINRLKKSTSKLKAYKEAPEILSKARF
jgi:hypothetical protein